MSLLRTRGLSAFYGDFQALFGIDFTIDAGETVAIIGANGAGKSTFLRAVTGMLKAGRDMVHFKSEPIGVSCTMRWGRNRVMTFPMRRREWHRAGRG